jgi:hypothetical protein
MAKVFRFVDPGTQALRLELLNRSGWYLGEGMSIGRTAASQKFLSQPGVDGVEMADAWFGSPVTMTIPLILTPQASASAMETLVNALNTELARDTNCIAYLPDDLTGNNFLIDTFKSELVSLHQGAKRRSPWVGHDGTLVVVQIERQPLFRGRGTMA